MTNQYDPIRMTTNRSSATANSKTSTLTLGPPNKARSVPVKPTTIPIEPVISTVFIKALSSFLPVLRVLMRAQPQRHVGRLHSLRYHAHQIVIQRIEVGLVPELCRELF
jgi:hypothetical protein